MNDEDNQPVGKYIVSVQPEATYPRRHQMTRTWGERAVFKALFLGPVIIGLMLAIPLYLMPAVWLAEWLERQGLGEFAAYAIALPLPLLIVGFFVFLHQRRRARRMGEKLEAVQSRSTQEAFDALVSEDPPRNLTEWKRVAKSLVKAGHVWRVVFVIRESRKDPLHVPLPYPIPFEPYRLNVNDPRKQLLLEPLDELGRKEMEAHPEKYARHTHNDSDSQESNESGVRMLKDLVRWVPNVFWMIMLLFWIGRGTWQMIQTGRPSIWLIVWVLFGISLLGNFFGGRKQWILVPGGLFLRLGRFFSSTTELFRLTSANSMLLITDIGLLVSDGERVEQVVVDEYEWPLLISAWTSELEPPKVDELSDLQ